MRGRVPDISAGNSWPWVLKATLARRHRLSETPERGRLPDEGPVIREEDDADIDILGTFGTVVDYTNPVAYVPSSSDVDRSETPSTARPASGLSATGEIVNVVSTWWTFLLRTVELEVDRQIPGSPWLKRYLGHQAVVPSPAASTPPSLSNATARPACHRSSHPCVWFRTGCTPIAVTIPLERLVHLEDGRAGGDQGRRRRAFGWPPGESSAGRG